MKKYFLFLLLQIMVIFIVTFIFRTIDERRLAAVIAGLVFIFSSLTYVVVEKYSGNWKSNPVFISSFIFLSFIALPLFIFRILQWEMEFNDVKIWGIDGPIFHRIANVFYMIMMGATLLKLFRSRSHSQKK